MTMAIKMDIVVHMNKSIRSDMIDAFMYNDKSFKVHDVPGDTLSQLEKLKYSLEDIKYVTFINK